MSKRGERKEVICDICGKIMSLNISSNKKHCSWECYRKSRIGKKPGNYGLKYHYRKTIKKQCPQCKIFFEYTPSEKKKYCSFRCFQEDRLTEEEKQKRKRLANLKWSKSEKHRKASIDWLRRHPERNRIARKTAWAYHRGIIKKQPCEVCGSEVNLHKHHPNYAEPLKIKWLCRDCHIALHKQIRKEMIENERKEIIK